MDATTINARIKAVRKAQRLNQTEFGKEIGLKQMAISNLEQDGNTVTDKNIFIICQRFRVRREWLVDGEGEMFVSGEPGIFAEFAREYKLSAQEQEVAKYLLGLSEGERANIMHYLQNIAAAMERGRQADAKAAEYHRQLDEALAAEKQDAAASSFSGSKKQA